MYKLQATIAKHSAVYSTAAPRDVKISSQGSSETGEEIFNSISNCLRDGVSNKKLKWVLALMKLGKIKTEDRNERMKNIILEKLRERLEENKKLAATYENKLKYNKRRGIIEIRKNILKNIDDLRLVYDILCGDVTNLEMVD